MAIEDHIMNLTDPAEREWLTWRQVCKQLEALGISPNSEQAKPLMAAIKLWGEENAVLSEQLTQLDARRFRDQARETYAPYVIEGWAP